MKVPDHPSNKIGEAVNRTIITRCRIHWKLLFIFFGEAESQLLFH